MPKFSATLVVLLAALSLSACGHPAPKPAAANIPDPKPFLTELYSHYTGSDKSFSAVELGHSVDYFDASMLTLMNENGKLTPKGDVGAIDGDPVCDCQDYGKLTAVITINDLTPAKAQATVMLSETDPSFDPSAKTPRPFRYKLVMTADGWRIDDITSPSMPSLKQLLIDTNKQDAANAKP